MPRLSVWSLRLSLLYLISGFSLGALMLANKGEPFAAWAWSLLPVHIEVLVFGFVIQFAMGMGYWILPRYPGGSRGTEWVVWASIGLLNAGLWLVSASAWFSLPGGWTALGHALEGVAALLFAAQMWRRIRKT